MNKNKSKKGFTLIELIAIILLIALIATIIFPNVLETYNNVKKSAMTVKENDVKNAAKMYISDCMDYDTKDSLSGCSNVDIITSSGTVFLEDIVNDQYTEEVEYDKNSCEGYVEFNESEYRVCLRCGESYKTNDLACKFDVTNDKYTEFRYSASGYQTFTATQGGKYKVELWGAQGGGDSTHIGGYGAYTSGVITLAKDATLYIYIGGQGGSSSTATNIGGYNGGGSSGNGDAAYSFGGGGATDVRYFASTPSTEDLAWNSSTGLASRIMVAAGGGGNFSSETYSSSSGAAGGLIGYESYNGTYNDLYPTGATQIASGTEPNNDSTRIGTFGYAVQSNTTTFGGGGGGGYYGGVTGLGQAGSGGSSFISGHIGCVAVLSSDNPTPIAGCLTGNSTASCAKHYSNKTFTNTKVIDGHGYSWSTTRGSQTTMPSTTYGKQFASGVGNTGNGFARITYLG